MFKKTMLVALMGVVVMGGPAWAEDSASASLPTQGQKTMPMKGDNNKDGIITRDEYMTRALMRFDRMDRNHDGRLTPDEMGMVHRNRMMDGSATPAPADE